MLQLSSAAAAAAAAPASIGTLAFVGAASLKRCISRALQFQSEKALRCCSFEVLQPPGAAAVKGAAAVAKRLSASISTLAFVGAASLR